MHEAAAYVPPLDFCSDASLAEDDVDERSPLVNGALHASRARSRPFARRSVSQPGGARPAENRPDVPNHLAWIPWGSNILRVIRAARPGVTTTSWHPGGPLLKTRSRVVSMLPVPEALAVV